MTGQRGVALILAILVTSFLSAIGLGLAMVVFMDRLATGNLRGSVAMLYAADAGLELAARELARLPDWNLALSGAERATFNDGAPDGVRAIPGGGSLDLTAATNSLNCLKPGNCTTAQMNANSRERPWGANNPRWRLYAYGPLHQLTTLVRPAECYLAVWIADDSREADDDPLADGDGGETPGNGVLRARAEAFGPKGSRRAVEAELVRYCLPDPGGAGCQLGIRVQSWQEMRQALP